MLTMRTALLLLVCTGARQVFSIIIELTAAAVTTITIEEIITKILILPKSALPNTFYYEICY